VNHFEEEAMETDAVIRTHAAPVSIDEPAAPFMGRVSWGGVLAGTAVAIATWMLLQVLGMGIGLVAVDVDEGNSWRAAAIGMGVWGFIAPIIAFMAGGLVAGRATRDSTRMGHAVSGLVVWSLSAIGGLIALGMVVSSLIGGTVSAGGAVLEGAGKAAGASISSLAGKADDAGNLASAFGLRASDALAPVNQRLRAEGKPAITPDQLEAAAKDILGDAVRAGQLDSAMLARSIADQTALSESDSREIARRIQTRYETVRADVAAKMAQAQQTATRAAQATADGAGKTMLGLFAALMLGLVAAVAGALVSGHLRTRTTETREY
jgi:hypothetical protein